jgi:hypothetical protein
MLPSEVRGDLPKILYRIHAAFVFCMVNMQANTINNGVCRIVERQEIFNRYALLGHGTTSNRVRIRSEKLDIGAMGGGCC